MDRPERRNGKENFIRYQGDKKQSEYSSEISPLKIFFRLIAIQIDSPKSPTKAQLSTLKSVIVFEVQFS